MFNKEPDIDLFEMRQALVLLARQRRTINYRDFAGLLGIKPPLSIHRITTALEALVREDQEHGQPILASLVVQKGPAAIPGEGFFQFLHELGVYDGDEQGPQAADWHRRELQRIWSHWDK